MAKNIRSTPGPQLNLGRSSYFLRMLASSEATSTNEREQANLGGTICLVTMILMSYCSSEQVMAMSEGRCRVKDTEKHRERKRFTAYRFYTMVYISPSSLLLTYSFMILRQVTTLGLTSSTFAPGCPFAFIHSATSSAIFSFTLSSTPSSSWKQVRTFLALDPSSLCETIDLRDSDALKSYANGVFLSSSMPSDCLTWFLFQQYSCPLLLSAWRHIDWSQASLTWRQNSERSPLPSFAKSLYGDLTGSVWGRAASLMMKQMLKMMRASAREKGRTERGKERRKVVRKRKEAALRMRNMRLVMAAIAILSQIRLTRFKSHQTILLHRCIPQLNASIKMLIL